MTKVRPKLVPELSCSNFEKSLKFYCDVLGFKVLFSRPDDQFAYLDLDGAQIMLEQGNDYWNTGVREWPYGRGINFQIEVSDAAQLKENILSSGCDLFRDSTEAWYKQEKDEVGFIELLVLDPDGYLLRFSQKLGIRRY